MANTVTISGMFGSNKTYFADSPVVIEVNGLEWPQSSPFKVVRIKVKYNGSDVGDFHAETGGQSSISFDISSALRAIWADYDLSAETAKAVAALSSSTKQSYERGVRQYSLQVSTEYISDDGVFTATDNGEFPGGRCIMGGLTEWERSLITDKRDADASHWENTNPRNGDASTKPRTTPERVGRDSITSWTDVAFGGTKSTFFPAAYNNRQGEPDANQEHAPLVLRDTIAYTDFLFLNRRGAVESCSALMKEAMEMEMEAKQYARVERPSFRPSRTVMAVTSGGRRSWTMSSGPQTREWAEWWVLEFLKSERHWMLYKGPGAATASYVPVVVEPAKKSTGIYDRAKQQMPSVEFTVTLAVEG